MFLKWLCKNDSNNSKSNELLLFPNKNRSPLRLQRRRQLGIPITIKTFIRFEFRTITTKMAVYEIVTSYCNECLLFLVWPNSRTKYVGHMCYLNKIVLVHGLTFLHTSLLNCVITFWSDHASDGQSSNSI